jgi:hypothetical protein
LTYFNSFFSFSFCFLLIHFVLISCFTMFLVIELTLKKHCVHVLKYSIDVSMDFLPRLFNFVVTSNQSINFKLLVMYIYILLVLWISYLLH